MATGSRVLSAWGAHSLLLPSPPSLRCTRKAAFPSPAQAPGRAGPPGRRSPPPSLLTSPKAYSCGVRGESSPVPISGSWVSGVLPSHGLAVVLSGAGLRFGRCGSAWLSTPCCPQNPACRQPPSQPGPILSQQLRLENRNPFGKGLALGTKSPSWCRARRGALGTAQWQQYSLRSATHSRLGSTPGRSITYSGSCVRSAPRNQRPGPGPCSRPRSTRHRSRHPSPLPPRP